LSSDNREWEKTVSLAAEFGGPDIPEWVIDEIMKFNRTLQESCKGPYGRDIGGFALAARVEGSLKHYHFEGADRIHKHRHGYIAADVGIPAARWQTLNRAEFRRYVVESVASTLHACITYAKQRKYDVNADKLLLDFAHAKGVFLNTYQ
jgi:hypothetical protein